MASTPTIRGDVVEPAAAPASDRSRVTAGPERDPAYVASAMILLDCLVHRWQSACMECRVKNSGRAGVAHGSPRKLVTAGIAVAPRCSAPNSGLPGVTAAPCLAACAHACNAPSNRSASSAPLYDLPASCTRHSAAAQLVCAPSIRHREGSTRCRFSGRSWLDATQGTNEANVAVICAHSSACGECTAGESLHAA